MPKFEFCTPLLVAARTCIPFGACHLHQSSSADMLSRKREQDSVNRSLQVSMVACVLIGRFILSVAGVATRRHEMSNWLGATIFKFARVRNTMVSSPGAPHGTGES
eukprot:6179597-Pleurochrysis_carterae.AAC.4